MSWAEEDWTVGLSGRVLQKVKELQVHQDRLSRENKQKQLQLDNIHTSLEKQTVKYEQVRGELQSVQRELQRVQDEAKAVITSRERLTQELQTKQAQVCSFEGQLDAARTLNNKLTQEVKRLEAELEKLQNSSRLADTTLFSTPCWNTASPWEHNGNKKEERSGHKDEGQSRTPNIRQRLQFSEVATASLPRQQHKNTPHRHPSDQSECFSTPLAAFPWERDDLRPAARRRSPPSPQKPCIDVVSQVQLEQGGCGKEDYRTETDISVSALRSQVSSLEEELNVKAGTLKSIQNEMVQRKKELAAKELSIQRARDELSLAHTRMAQESERASGAEQRLKQLQEELKCQRQNSESSRLQHQQRSKELEKQHQRDLMELQKERQCLEKQHQQEANKLNQELQQARTLHNALQAQTDKLSLQKQVLDKELHTLKEKLKWTEGQLQESQKKEAQSQAKLTEAMREAEGMAVSLEQSRKKERTLEEEGRRLAEERADALCLLKELQEQKAASVPLAQPVQFPVGQGFSAQPLHTVHSRPSAHIKRATTDILAEQKREEEMNKKRAETTTSYPSDREPGEGIDSEHITVSPDSESISREGHRGKRYKEIGSDSSRANKHSKLDHVLSSSHSAVDSPTNNSSIDDDHCDLMVSPEKTPSPKWEQSKASEDLVKENATLRSELHDVREELQKRLEDLEAQRRAETEARTRLKQLSRKHASQSVEKEEQDKEWRAQLESERAETERLRKAMTVLETEVNRRREEKEMNEREEQEEEKSKALEDRESEMIELNIQLKKQLVETKAQLALEREERQREEEERNKITNSDIDLKKELSMELEELKAELEGLKRSRKDPEEENISVANSPLTYLTLREDELNSNKLLPSPEEHLLFCQSTNQQNIIVSQAAVDLIEEVQTVAYSEQSSQEVSDKEDIRQNYLVGSSLSDHREMVAEAQKNEPASSDYTKEVLHLKKLNAKETERAKQYQVKLEALQNQVTRQTQQLTMAFEKQSQHISGLLAELQEKESVLLSQEEELQRHKQELDALKAKKEGEEMKIKEVEDGEEKEEARDEKSVKISGLKPNQENESVVTSLTTNSSTDSDPEFEKGQPENVIFESERPTPISSNEALCFGEQHSVSIDSDKIHSNPDSVIGETECSQNGQTADLVAELLSLQHTDGENQEYLAKQSQNTGNAVLPCLSEERSPGALNDITTMAQQSLPQTSNSSQDEEADSIKKNKRTLRTEEELEAVCQLQVKHLQQQVVELHMRVKALSEETKQQAEELAIWRLASKPAPTFDHLPPNADNQSETQDPCQALTTMAQVQAPYLGVEKGPVNVTIVREDELILSCSSSKMQGTMLFSRLQNQNSQELNHFHVLEKTAAQKRNSQDTAKIDKDPDKENQEINLLHLSSSSQTQQKEKSDSEVGQLSSEKMGLQHATKVFHNVSGPKQTHTVECHMGDVVTKSDASRVAKEVNTTDGSSDRDVLTKTKTKSVSSQTEESLHPGSAPSPPELHCAYTQTEEEEEEEEDEEELVKSPSDSPVPLSEGTELGDKILFSGSFPIPADPARLAERIRRNRTQLSAAFDDTEYEPYGLPEVVMKGFADIPSGPSCPYIVRRGLLGTSVVPVPQKNQGQEEETD